jgi:hypothetical protein
MEVPGRILNRPSEVGKLKRADLAVMVGAAAAGLTDEDGICLLPKIDRIEDG